MGRRRRKRRSREENEKGERKKNDQQADYIRSLLHFLLGLAQSFIQCWGSGNRE